MSAITVLQHAIGIGLSLLNNIEPNQHFSFHNLRNIGRKQNSGYVKKHVIWMGNFYFESPVCHVTVDFKKVVCDLFHAGSTLTESACIN